MTEPTDQDEARQRAIEEAGIQFPMAMLAIDHETHHIPHPTNDQPGASTSSFDSRRFSIQIVGRSGHRYYMLGGPIIYVENANINTAAAGVADLLGLDPDDAHDFIEYAALGIGEATIEIGRAPLELAGLPLRIVVRRIK